MKKLAGYTSFEFYVVVTVIGLIVLVGVQHYSRLAAQTQQLSFEVLARNFSASVFNLHARWLMSKQASFMSTSTTIDASTVQFTPEGWPLAVGMKNLVTPSVSSCLSLWQSLLQNSPPISYAGGDAYKSHSYHLTITPEKHCHFEFITARPNEYFFEYSPLSGQVLINLSSIPKQI